MDKTKIIYSGDIHLGKKLKDSVKMKEYGHQKFTELIYKCIEENINILALVGDIFDTTHPPTDTLNFAINEIEKLLDINKNIRVIILNGNHDKISDYYNKTSPLLPISKINKNRIIYCETSEYPFTFQHKNINFIIQNFAEPKEKFKQILSGENLKSAIKKNMINILLSHIPIQDEIYGDDENSIYYKDLEKLGEYGIRYVVLGDIHKPTGKIFKDIGIWFTGSINHTTIKEYIEKDLSYLYQEIPHDVNNISKVNLEDIEYMFLKKPKIIKYKTKKDLEKIDDNTIVIIDQEHSNKITYILKRNPLYIAMKEIEIDNTYLDINENISKQDLNKPSIDIKEIIDKYYKDKLTIEEFDMLKTIINANNLLELETNIQQKIEKLIS